MHLPLQLRSAQIVEYSHRSCSFILNYNPFCFIQKLAQLDHCSSVHFVPVWVQIGHTPVGTLSALHDLEVSITGQEHYFIIETNDSQYVGIHWQCKSCLLSVFAFPDHSYLKSSKVFEDVLLRLVSYGCVSHPKKTYQPYTLPVHRRNDIMINLFLKLHILCYIPLLFVLMDYAWRCVASRCICVTHPAWECQLPNNNLSRFSHHRWTSLHFVTWFYRKRSDCASKASSCTRGRCCLHQSQYPCRSHLVAILD